MTSEPPQQDDFASRAQAIKEAIAREDTQAAPPRRERKPAPAPAPPEPPAEDGSDTAVRAARAEARAERVVVGEDDLLADVDSEVNEDEFKW